MLFFATAAAGTEEALFAELRALGAQKLAPAHGGVRFRGPSVLDGARIALTSRVAVRVSLHVAEVRARDAQALYDDVRGLAWQQWLDPDRTLSVRAVGHNAQLQHSGFVALRCKDAIVDSLRDRYGRRPSVHPTDPDVLISVVLFGGQASVYLDLAGFPLHRRGYRQQTGAAPLKETLAAALLWLSGWRGEVGLWDPMCGSGTIAIEADLLARGAAPGLLHGPLGMERWRCHDEDARRGLAALREELRSAERAEGPAIVGSDRDPAVVEIAQRNAANARSKARFLHADAATVRAPARTQLLMNPPLGERMSLEVAALCALRAGNPTASFAVLALPHTLDAHLGEPAERLPLRNGAVDCELLRYGPMAPAAPTARDDGGAGGDF